MSKVQKSFLTCLEEKEEKKKKERNRSEITEINRFYCSRHPLIEQSALSIGFFFKFPYMSIKIKIHCMLILFLIYA